MISIRTAVDEVERYFQIRALAVDCYVSAIRNAAAYAVEMDADLTATHRKQLNALAEEICSGEESTLEQSRATLRGLLRDYRDKASRYISDLRNALANTARALEEMMGSLAQTDGDHDHRVRAAVSKLREAAVSADLRTIRAVTLNAAESIDQSIAEMRNQHQITISQFQAEIRVLHRRIDALEAAAAVDNLTRLLTRTEMQRHLAEIPAGTCIVMVKVTGLRSAGVHYNPGVAAEVAGAFARRLRNSLPENSTIGRWSEEEFLGIAPVDKAEAVRLAKWMAEHLAGPYSCLQDGKIVRPSLQLSVGVIDPAGEDPEHMMRRIRDFLPGR